MSRAMFLLSVLLGAAQTDASVFLRIQRFGGSGAVPAGGTFQILATIGRTPGSTESVNGVLFSLSSNDPSRGFAIVGKQLFPPGNPVFPQTLISNDQALSPEGGNNRLKPANSSDLGGYSPSPLSVYTADFVLLTLTAPPWAPGTWTISPTAAYWYDSTATFHSISDLGSMTVAVNGVCPLLEVSAPGPLSQRVCPLDPLAQISVNVNSETLPTYQWRLGTTILTNGAKYKGVDTPTLVIHNPTASDTSTHYYCVVGNGCATLASSDAQVVVGSANPSILADPTDTARCFGSSATFTVSASNTASYSWLRGSSILVNSDKYSGANTATLTVQHLTPADQGNDYYCVVGDGACVIASAGATLTVLQPFACAGDFNQDCAVDSKDLALFESCATGAAVPYDLAHLAAGCAQLPDSSRQIFADFDHDGDVDQADFGVFQRCFSGSSFQVTPACLN